MSGTEARPARAGFPEAWRPRARAARKARAEGRNAHAVIVGDGRVPRAWVSPGVAWDAPQGCGAVPRVTCSPTPGRQGRRRPGRLCPRTTGRLRPGAGTSRCASLSARPQARVLMATAALTEPAQVSRGSVRPPTARFLLEAPEPRLREGLYLDVLSPLPVRPRPGGSGQWSVHVRDPHFWQPKE